MWQLPPLLIGLQWTLQFDPAAVQGHPRSSILVSIKCFFVQFSDVLLYASRGMTSSVQFKVHGRLPVSGITVSNPCYYFWLVFKTDITYLVFTGLSSVCKMCYRYYGKLFSQCPLVWGVEQNWQAQNVYILCKSEDYWWLFDAHELVNYLFVYPLISLLTVVTLSIVCP